MRARPVSYVLEAAEPVRHGERDVFEPCVAVGVAAAPLRFAHVHVRVDEDAPCERGARDVGPDFEARCRGGPGGVVGEHGLGDAGSVCWAQGGG